MLELEKLYAVAAKERQREHAGTAPGKAKTLMGDLPEVITPPAREQAAAKVKVSGSSVQHAKKVAAVAPDLARAQVELGS